MFSLTDFGETMLIYTNWVPGSEFSPNRISFLIFSILREGGRSKAQQPPAQKFCLLRDSLGSHLLGLFQSCFTPQVATFTLKEKLWTVVSPKTRDFPWRNWMSVQVQWPWHSQPLATVGAILVPPLPLTYTADTYLSVLAANKIGSYRLSTDG